MVKTLIRKIQILSTKNPFRDFFVVYSFEMKVPKLSIVNPITESRVDKVREQIKLLRSDLKIAGLEELDQDPAIKKDRYIAAIPILLKNFFEFLEKELVLKRPEIDWSKEKAFKKSFLKAYNTLISEESSNYFRKLRQQVLESLNKKEKGEIQEITEEERAYLTFCLDDANPNGGVTVLSPVDGLFILSHIAGLIIQLVGENFERLETLMNSRSVTMFTNSLMINEAGSMMTLIKILEDRRKYGDHKNFDYDFDINFFQVSEQDQLVLRNDLLSLIKKVYEKNGEGLDKVQRRNCPASYAPKETSKFFKAISAEILIQFKNYLENKK